MVKELHDVKQHPSKYGETNALKEMIDYIERRFSELYESAVVRGFSGFRTGRGTRFYVNGIYEWNTVFLEYEDFEDGDMHPLNDDRNTMFEELYQELLRDEK